MLRQLVLIPTQLERQFATLLDDLQGEAIAVELCGIGAVAAAARTAALIATLQPRAVLLVGIAGVLQAAPASREKNAASLPDDEAVANNDTNHAEAVPAGKLQLRIGHAYEFGSVACFGIGVGQGGNHQTLQQLKWNHWSNPYIADQLELHRPATVTAAGAGQLLSVCSASATPDEAACHRQKFPLATAEDMEGFSVAVACRLEGVPLRIVRGMSNFAGDRDPRHWRIREAMLSASQLARQILEQNDNP